MAFNIVPFSLPNTQKNEIRFEEPRDIDCMRVRFKRTEDAGKLAEAVGISYLRNRWPETRLEELPDIEQPCRFGWNRIDDWFNTTWQSAAIVRQWNGPETVTITFRSLSEELPDQDDYPVTFRRAIGVRVDLPSAEPVSSVEVFTRSAPASSLLRVEIHPGGRTPDSRTSPDRLRVEGYNAAITAVEPVSGCRFDGTRVTVEDPDGCVFTVATDHMTPGHRYSGDDGHVRFAWETDGFTISLTHLVAEGPVWFEEYGFFVSHAESSVSFQQYIEMCRRGSTIADAVKNTREQTYGNAFHGQPRPHAVAYSVGTKHARQRFWLEANGDIVLTKRNVLRPPAGDTPRYANRGDGRFFFGLEGWRSLARYPDPPPAISYSYRFRRKHIELTQRCIAVPLGRRIPAATARGDESVACLVSFRFTNTGKRPGQARLTLEYSQESSRAQNWYTSGFEDGKASDWLVPAGEREELDLRDSAVYGAWEGHPALRCAFDGTMAATQDQRRIVFAQDLQPGDSCSLVLKVPFVSLLPPEELQRLLKLDFEQSSAEVRAFWEKECGSSATLTTPIEQLTDLHAAHQCHVQITDFAMPDAPFLINTSVGTSTYGNFSNESCMINRELDERGLFEDVERRLETWVRYQGTVEQPGNFTDYRGMYYGAGGFESGSYNQHHGWVLWRLADHYLLSGNRAWFAKCVDSLIAGADWVFRQRKNTMKTLPHSRGWEYGFLPAGSLEDVTDFWYWLSTNSLTWRGCEVCAQALEEYEHPEAGRVRKETDAYAADLRKGFETMRQYSPLVRLRNGVWVPHYPSRLYCRGRDVGWIREVLEGSVYLLISGLYDPDSREAGWILDDFLDNRYSKPPYGYGLADGENEWFSRTGFSIQPNLLAGLLPHLDRDETKLYIWMFYNAWCACYREEIGGMVEHPMPVLGYSNPAHFKTSDQANAVMWLRYMLVCAGKHGLRIGAAVPREWFAALKRDGGEIALRGVHTRFGQVSVVYTSTREATVSLSLRRTPERILVRFRHPEKKRLSAVTVNGAPWSRFSPDTEDVDVSGLTGDIRVAVEF